MYRIVATLMICLLVLPPNAVSAQDHVVSAAELRLALQLASEKRHNDIKTVRAFFGTDKVKKSLDVAHLDPKKVQTAVSALNDEELSQLAGRVQAAQKEMVAGALTNEQLTYIVIALGAAVLVLVLK
jgi:hypothetical protein